MHEVSIRSNHRYTTLVESTKNILEKPPHPQHNLFDFFKLFSFHLMDIFTQCQDINPAFQLKDFFAKIFPVTMRTYPPATTRDRSFRFPFTLFVNTYVSSSRGSSVPTLNQQPPTNATFFWFGFGSCCDKTLLMFGMFSNTYVVMAFCT